MIKKVLSVALLMAIMLSSVTVSSFAASGKKEKKTSVTRSVQTQTATEKKQKAFVEKTYKRCAYLGGARANLIFKRLVQKKGIPCRFVKNNKNADVSVKIGKKWRRCNPRKDRGRRPNKWKYFLK